MKKYTSKQLKMFMQSENATPNTPLWWTLQGMIDKNFREFEFEDLPLNINLIAFDKAIIAWRLRIGI